MRNDGTILKTDTYVSVIHNQLLLPLALILPISFSTPYSDTRVIPYGGLKMGRGGLKIPTPIEVFRVSTLEVCPVLLPPQDGASKGRIMKKTVKARNHFRLTVAIGSLPGIL